MAVGYIVDTIISFAAGVILTKRYYKRIAGDAIAIQQAALDRLSKGFYDAREEYKKLKAGAEHKLDKVLSVF